MKYEIRKARLNEVDVIMMIINQAKAEMAKVSDQWQNGYPNADTIVTDIEANVGYVLVVDGQVIGYAAILEGPDENYTYIEGAWKSDAPYFVIHRVAIANEYKGQGWVHRFFEYVKNQSNVVRVDTHEKNSSMQRAILKDGFEYCGVVYVGVNQPRFAYEWIRK